MEVISPYAQGEWIQIDKKCNIDSVTSSSQRSSSKEEDDYEEEESKDKVDILRGPVWNYGRMKEDEETYFSELLFGKKHKTILTPDELILKGELWTPSKPTTASLSAYIFRKLKKADPDSIALLEIETGRSLTYGEAVRQAPSLACGLRWAGVLPGHVIAVVAFNSLEAHLMIMASLLVGAITALVDSGLNAVEIGRLLRIANPRLVFCEGGKTVSKVEVALGYMITLRQPQMVINAQKGEIPCKTEHICFQELLAEVEQDFKPAFQHSNPDNPVFILFTSGISGTSKGALIPERYFMKNSIFVEHVFSISALPYTTLLTTAIFWVIGISSLLSNLINGHRIAFFRGQAPEAVLIKVLHKYKVTVWVTAPNTLQYLLNWPAKPRNHRVKLILVTGMAIGQTALTQIRDQVFAGNVQICQLYGMTEIGIVTANLPNANNLGSVGKLLGNIQMKIVEECTGLALGPNQEGQLYFKSDTVMLGYCNKPDEMAELLDGEGFLSTGDLGYYDHFGFVYITGRMKNVIKWRCYQVIPQAVEEVLLSQPGVTEAMVVGLPHDTDGELVAAAIVCSPSYEQTQLSVLEKTVNDQLSSSMKIRGGVHCLMRFPCNSAGKPIKANITKELLQRYKYQEKRESKDDNQNSFYQP